MNLKIGLSLSLAVLLLHLVLLQTLPLTQPLNRAPSEPLLTTRSVLLTRTPAAGTPQAAAKQQGKTPIPAARTAARQPAAQAERAPESAVSDTGPPALVAVDPDAATAQAPASVTSAPAVAAVNPAGTPDSAAAPQASTLAAATPEAAPPQPSTEVAFNPESLPPSVKLVYQVEANKFPYTLSGEFLWQRGEQGYQAQLSISTFGQTRLQTSRGQIDPFGLAPERFSDKYRSEVAAHFNRAQGLVSFSANTPSLSLLPGAQDRLSVLVQLAALVASAPQNYGPGTTLQVQTIGPRDGDMWLFTFGNMETLELPGGSQQGLKLVRQPRQPYDQKLEVWLAPGLAYLPARIRITEANGTYVDQKWAASQPVDSP